MIGIVLSTAPILAQEENDWSSQRTIPGYHPETDPPILISDQNGTVHAFSSQWLAGEEAQSLKAIMYNQWTRDGGWTQPIDILLSPNKKEARLLDALMDQSGMMHLIFYGGDNTAAQIHYSKVPATSAGQSSAWSKPVLVGPKAHDPQNGIIESDNNGNLLLIYAGDQYGTGWYTAASSDNGDTWSEVTLFSPTYYEGSSPYYLRTVVDESGLLHAVWTIQDLGNYGKALYYANFDFTAKHWSNPLQLAVQSNPGNLGTQAPTIIEYDDSLFVMYYDGITNGLYFVRSLDGGRSWSERVAPFPQVGLNGPGFFVVDSNNDLHFFWGQRIIGSPDIHGLWHSTWQETGWSDFEAVVTGSKILDKVGFTSFDPVTPYVAIIGGNEVLATWRSDYGSRGNGVWYSTAVLDAPQLPALPLPTVPSPPVINKSAAVLSATPEPTREARPELRDELDLTVVAVRNPTDGLLIGLIPVTLLILSIIAVRQLSQNRNR